MSQESEVRPADQSAQQPARAPKINLDDQYKPIGIQAVSSAAEIQMHKHHDEVPHR